MYEKFTRRQICLFGRIRRLWSQHVYWTRFFIISTVSELGDLQAATKHLLQISKDFAQLLCPFFGGKAAGRFDKLFTEHLMIGGDLVNAAKNGQTDQANTLRAKWYENADEIAEFLSSLNRCWNEKMWKEMLYSHLKMTEKEAALRLEKNYTADINNFDAIENEAMKMADHMFCGIAICRL